MKQIYVRFCRALLCILSFFPVHESFSQDIGNKNTISGRVVDEKGGPLPGVTVLVTGTNQGTGTGPDGQYYLHYTGNATSLTFSALGFTKQIVQVGGRTTINVTLAGNLQNLSEVVVTGYTSQRKADITGAVSVVNAKDINTFPTSNVGSALQGKAPGVVIGSDANPGGNVNIRIRGLASFGSNDPLFIVDGVQLNGFSLQDINPADIASIQVLKDASAAAVYGVQAANGVVIISTRKGISGKTKLNFDSYFGLAQVNHSDFPKLLNPTQYANFVWQNITNQALAGGAAPVYSDREYGKGTTPVLPDYLLAGTFQKPLYGLSNGDPAVDPSNESYTPLNLNTFGQIVKANKSGTNWYDVIFRPALVQSYSLSASGGNETSHFLFSGNYLNQQGALKYTYYTRYGAKVNSDFTIKNHVRIGENINYTYSTQNGIGDGAEGEAVFEASRIQAIIPVYDVTGQFAGTKGPGGNAANPLALLQRGNANSNINNRIIGNGYLDFDIIKGLSAKSNFGIDYQNYNATRFQVPNLEQNEGTSITQLQVFNNYSYKWTWTNSLNYKNIFAEKHSINVFVATEAVKDAFRAFDATRQGYSNLIDPNQRYLSFGTGTQSNESGFVAGSSPSDFQFDYSFFSYIAKASYAYMDKYLFDATFRRDGSSNFGTQKYGNFPGVSAGWRISQESFLKPVRWISDLKLRVGYGVLGNANIPSYNAYNQYAPTPTNNTYAIGGSANSTTPGTSLTTYGNPATRWERDATLNGGFDGTFFDGKFDVILDLYSKRSSGLLVNPTNPATQGTANAAYLNVGKMTNKGFDIGMNYRGNSANNAFKYTIGLNLSHYKNKVTALDPQNPNSFFGDQGALRFGQVTRTVVGQPIGQFYGYRIVGIFQTQQQAAAAPPQSATGIKNNTVGTFQFADVNGDKVVDAKDRTFIGDPNPKLTGGITLTASYANFDVYAFFQGVYGNKIFNYTKYFTDFQTFVGNYSTRILNSWTPTNPNATLPIINGTYTSTESAPSNYYVEPGSYTRFKNLQLGYTFTKSTITGLGIDRLRIYLQATNLFTITKYSGLDPDITITAFSNQGNPRRQVDLLRGVDQAGYPSVRQFLFGINLSF